MSGSACFPLFLGNYRSAVEQTLDLFRSSNIHFRSSVPDQSHPSNPCPEQLVDRDKSSDRQSCLAINDALPQSIPTND